MPSTSSSSEPTWAVAELFPLQGQWSEADYLTLDTNRLIELCDGCLEVLPMPTDSHQAIVGYLLAVLLAIATHSKLGIARVAPLRVRLWEGWFREPDVVFMLAENEGRISEEYWDRADLVMEVVSEGTKNRSRDLKTKRAEYARARIPEYWIIDPRKETIQVLRLAGKQYRVAGTYQRGTPARSVLLPEFEVEVSAVFDAARGGQVRKPNRKRRDSR